MEDSVQIREIELTTDLLGYALCNLATHSSNYTLIHALTYTYHCR